MATRGKPLIRLERADADVLAALDYYLLESPDYAEPFLEALEKAFRHIQRSPATGSPRYAHALDIPGLRSWLCGRYPYVVFYMEHADRIDIWRVLHTRQDIPAWIGDGGDAG